MVSDKPSVTIAQEPFKVPKQILNDFYLLADLKKEKRCKGAVNILTGIQTFKGNRQNIIKYCLGRLIKGLPSARLAARVGFATVLTEMIKEHKIPILDVLAEVEKSLPVDKSSEIKENSIGQILALLALVRAASENQISEELCAKFVSMSMFFYDMRSNGQRSYLQPLCVQAILILSQKVGEQMFQSKIWPRIKSHCQISIDSATADEFHFVFGLKKLFPKFTTKHCKFLSSDNSKVFADSMTDFTKFIVSASTTYPTVHPGVVDLVEFIVADRKLLEEFWPKVFESKILKHEHRLVINYGLQLLCKVLPQVKTDDQIDIVLSQDLLKVLLKSFVDGKTVVRFSRRYANDVVEEMIKISSTNTNFAEKLIMAIFGVSMEFDRLSNVKFTERILAVLNLETTRKVFDHLSKNVDFTNEKCSDAQNSLKFLTIIFVKNHKDDEFAQLVLNFLADLLFDKLRNDKANKSLREAAAVSFFDCIGYLCDFHVKPDSTKLAKDMKWMRTLEILLDSLRKIVGDEHKLMKHSKKIMKKIRENENVDTVSKCFGVLFGYLSLWAAYEPKEYEEILKEISTCYEEFLKNESSTIDGDSWTDVLIDVILTLSSKSNRHLKLPLDTAMFYLAPVLKFRHLEPILKVISEPDTETVEVDDEFEPIEGAEEADDDDDDDLPDDDVDDDDVDMQNVDAALVEALENALKTKKTDDDTESVSSDLSDDTMIRLDEQLADVFRQHLKNKKNSANKIDDEAEKFRLRCFDLIHVVVNGSQNVEIIINILVPLLNMQIAFYNEKSNVNVARILHIEKIVLKNKNFPNVDDEKQQKLIFIDLFLNVVGQIFDISKTLSNAIVQKSCADSLSFLLKLEKKISSTDLKKTFNDQLRVIIEKHLNEFFKDPACLTSVTLFQAIFDNLPNLGFSFLPLLTEILFDSNARLFRRADVCVLCQSLFRKQNIADPIDKSTKKALKKFCAALRPNLIDILQNLNVLNSSKNLANASDEKKEKFKNSMDVIKPRFISSLLNIFSTLISLVDAERAKKLMDIKNDGDDQDELLKCLKILTITQRFKHKRGRLATLHASLEETIGKNQNKIFKRIVKKLSLKVDDAHIKDVSSVSEASPTVGVEAENEPKKKKTKR